MSASNEQLGDQAREESLKEIIQEEEARLGPFVLEKALEEEKPDEHIQPSV